MISGPGRMMYQYLGAQAGGSNLQEEVNASGGAELSSRHWCQYRKLAGIKHTRGAGAGATCGPSGRGRMGAAVGSRGFTPGSAPAALQAAGRGVEVAQSRSPGDSPRALLPRPFRPPGISGQHKKSFRCRIKRGPHFSRDFDGAQRLECSRPRLPRPRFEPSNRLFPASRVELEDLGLGRYPDLPGCRTDGDGTSLHGQRRQLLAVRREAQDSGPKGDDPGGARLRLTGDAEARFLAEVPRLDRGPIVGEMPEPVDAPRHVGMPRSVIHTLPSRGFAATETQAQPSCGF